MRSVVAVAIVVLVSSAWACTGGPDQPGGSSGLSSGGLTSSGGASSSGGSSSGGSSSGGSSSGGSSGNATPLNPASYATDCVDASECTAVYFGSNACCGGCPNAAIATKDLERYTSDKAAFQASCGDRGVGCPDIACVEVAPGCSNGQCTVGF